MRKKDRVLRLAYGFVAIVCAIAIIALIAFGLFGVIKIVDSYRYNGGICRKCGGKYVYIESVGGYGGAEYIYGCDKCGRRIELSEYQTGE